jgi:hypothetical protein
MTDTLAQDVPIQPATPPVVSEFYTPSKEVTYPSDVTPGINYFVECKYQNYLPAFYVCFVLCQLDAVESKIGIWTSDPFQFESS